MTTTPTRSFDSPAATPVFTTYRDRRVTRELISTRTRDLAECAVRISPHVTQADYEQAKHDRTGETGLDRQAVVINAAA